MFDAYAQFEESMLSAKMETTSEMGSTEEGDFEICACNDQFHTADDPRT